MKENLQLIKKLNDSAIKPFVTTIILLLLLVNNNKFAIAQKFKEPVINPYSLVSVTQTSRPAFADIDNDGDFDLFSGNAAGEFVFYINGGTSVSPVYSALAVTNPFGLTNITTYSGPAFADLDNDGDNDMISGSMEGNFYYFKNSGTASAPAFDSGIQNSFSLVKTAGYGYSTPSLADLDNDGKIDLIAGDPDGNFYYYPNRGTISVPLYDTVLVNPFNLDASGYVSFGLNPVFADIDEDGDFDILTGSGGYNSLLYFKNTGTVSSPSFANAVEDPFGLDNYSYYHSYPSPAVIDLTGDGLPDILSGCGDGSFRFFEGSCAPDAPIITSPASWSTQACLNSTVTLTAQGVAEGTIVWYWGSNFLGSGNSIVTTVIGTVTYLAYDSTSCGRSSGSDFVNIGPFGYGSPYSTTPYGNKNICKNTSTTLWASSNAPIGEHWITWWTTNDSNAVLIHSGDTLITGNISSDTTFYYRDSTCEGVSSRQAIDVFLKKSSINGSNFSETMTVFTGNSFDMTISASNIASAQWFQNENPVATGASGANIYHASASAAYADSGYYWCRVIGICGDTLYSDTIHLMVEKRPIYVKTNGYDEYSGASWQYAYQTIDKAMSVAIAGDIIWVAKGTYLTNVDSSFVTPAIARNKTFKIKSGVKIYGGFAGTETNISQRANYGFDEVNQTVLSGELGVSGLSDNAYHVLTIVNVSSSTLIDGFSVHSGYAWDNSSPNFFDNYGGGFLNLANGSASSPIFNNCSFAGNASKYGGAGCIAATNNGTSTPIFTNCLFSNNYSGFNGGGAVFFMGSNTNSNLTTQFIRCWFKGNYSQTGPGAIAFDVGTNSTASNLLISNSEFSGNFVYSSGPSVLGLWFGNNFSIDIVNSTFSKNNSSVGMYGGTINTDNIPHLNITNSIFYDNYNGGKKTIDSLNSSISNKTITYSLIANITDSTNNNIDGSTNPLFVNPAQFNFHLQAGSPCLNTGLNSINTELSDVEGNDRIQDTIIDMGAYEGAYGPCSSDTIFASFSGCQGYSVTVGTDTYDSTGVYFNVLTSVAGCDSLVQTTLTIYQPSETTEIVDTICSGDFVEIGGTTYNSTGVYNNYFTNAVGCDSLVKLYLTVIPGHFGTFIRATPDTSVICSGNTLTLDASNCGIITNHTYLSLRYPSLTQLAGVTEFTIENMIYLEDISTQVLFSNNSGTELGSNIFINVGTNYFQANLPNGFPINKWFHLAYVFNGNATTLSENLKVYIDGVEQTLNIQPWSNLIGSASMGTSYRTYLKDWKGKMKNIRFWDKAKSQIEIDGLYNASNSSISNNTNLIAEYKLNHTNTILIENTSTFSGYSFNLLDHWGGQIQDSVSCWINETYSWSNGIQNGFAFNPSFSTGYYSYYLTVTDVSTGCATVDTFNITVESCITEFNISGTVTYDNLSSTAINNSTVYLHDDGSSILDSTVTDASGNYLFDSIPNGSYGLSVSTTKPLGDVNATDALLVQQHFAEIITLVDDYLIVADVNASSSVNTTDALFIQNRFVGAITSFPTGDWHLNSQPVNVSNSDVTIDFKALCFGDVNASYIPPFAKSGNEVIINSTESIDIAFGNTVEIPIKVEVSEQVSAISLVLTYSESLIEVLTVNSEVSGMSDFIYNIENGQIRIAWNKIQPVNLNSNDVLFTLNVKSLTNDISTLILTTNSESEFADANANVISNFPLNLPSLNLGVTGVTYSDISKLSINFYPNPVKESAIISYSLPLNGKVNINLYDVDGRLVKKIADLNQNSGYHSITLNTNELAQGIYQCAVSFEVNSEISTERIIISVIK